MAVAKATMDFILPCIEGNRFRDEIGTTAEWYVRYSLGTAAHLYHRNAALDEARR